MIRAVDENSSALREYEHDLDVSRNYPSPCMGVSSMIWRG
jgi:hypothetical protein